MEDSVKFVSDSHRVTTDSTCTDSVRTGNLKASLPVYHVRSTNVVSTVPDAKEAWLNIFFASGSVV